MKLTTLLISFFLTLQTIGQPLQEIRKFLKNKNFQGLKVYVDNAPKSNVTVYWETLRDIIPNYQEAILKIEEHKLVNDGTGGDRIYNYHVNILTTATQVFDYDFKETKYNLTENDKWNEHDTTLERFRDDNQYNELVNSFREIYNDTLNYNDLFLTSIVYGSHCGIAGINPPYMDELNFLLINKEVETIRQWLKSPNAEKQLYAIRGYRVLVNHGYRLTNEEKRILEIVKQKNGTVSTCSGCTFMTGTFQGEVALIDSLPKELLVPEKTSYNQNYNQNVVRRSFQTKRTPIDNGFENVLFGIGILLGLGLLAFLYLKRRTKTGDG